MWMYVENHFPLPSAVQLMGAWPIINIIIFPNCECRGFPLPPAVQLMGAWPIIINIFSQALNVDVGLTKQLSK